MSRHWSLALLLFLPFTLLFAACSPSEEAIQEAVQVALTATQESQPSPAVEPTPVDTSTPLPTDTPQATPTPTSTSTPEPSPTPRPSLTPTPWPTLPPDIVAAGGHCIDQVTGDSFVYLHDVESFLNRQDAYLKGIVDNTDGQLSLIMYFSYIGSDWLFIDELVLNVDGDVINLTPDLTDGDVLNGGNIVEYGYVEYDQHDEEAFNQYNRIATGDKVIARLSGSEGNHDHELTEIEQAALQYGAIVIQALDFGALTLEAFEERCP